ncbi:putative membrane protein YphA (DoxX/SURF4 family) [Paenibacillus phyllosphaerae]|uniref:Putative membrane protein YphA (DoxX/SURF4 family) n=1 Tax=Paenibacillus phyllosphaerae TaxID=274593 RepID=A0A7W5B059_9BACL|nr:MauE/DoxX family redox-associated membrane protein [Paenibacillus phyllosphaerae]MBB3111979.1 putative membrane protein YphA (DoxX/SURF4 family) [Paenibacillus phyllosphaerae]
MDKVLVCIEWVFVIILVVIYYKSSVQKINNSYGFVQVLDQYNMLPKSLTPYIAPVVAILELVSALWLLFPSLRLEGAIIGGAMQTLFLLIALINFNKPLKYGCGCFEISLPKVVTIKHIIFNLSLLAIFLTIIIVTFEG